IHSRGVSHGEIREANIILVPGAHNCLQIMFFDFGAATTWSNTTEDEEKANIKNSGRSCVCYHAEAQ
ncbi:hypothetical protein BDV93DRAFT_522179, partial [Ceratobasidium sp. AG-I]